MTAESALVTLPGLSDITECVLLCRRAPRAMGRGAEAMSRAGRAACRAWSARQPSCNQNIYRHLGWGAPFILGPSWTPGHGALWILGSLIPPQSFSGINVIWSDTKQDLLLEPLDWNVLLNFFLNDGMKWLQLKMASQLWGEVPLAPTLSHLTRISSSLLCIWSMCTLHAICWPGEGSLQ